MKRMILLLSVLAWTTLANAQQEWLELARSDIRTARMGMVAAAMDLTPAQQEVFWPLYREYAVEQDALLEKRMEMLKLFARSFENMTDAAANSIAEQSFAMQRARLERREKYFNKFAEVLGPVLAARFIQVDGQVTTLLDFELMKSTPLIEPPAAEE